MRRLSIAAAVLTMGTLTGCSQSQSIDPNPPAGNAAFDAMGSVSFAPADVTTPLTHEQMRASMDITHEALVAVDAAFVGADPDDVQDLDRRLQRALAGLDGEVRARAEQLAAAAMIRVALDRSPDTEETREAAAVYTQYLVDRKTPQPDLVLDGLAETGEAWTPAQRRHAASVAVTAAERREAITTRGTERKLEAAGARPAPVTDAAVEQLRSIAQGAE